MKNSVKRLLPAVFFLAGLITFGSLSCRTYYHLTKYGVKTKGTVIDLSPLHHGAVGYAYEAHGHRSGRWLPLEPNPDFKMLKIGDSVVVYYSSLNPTVSILGEPVPAFRGELVSVFLMALMLSIFSCYLLGHRASI